MKAISRVLFFALLTVAGATAASAQPFPNPYVRYVAQYPHLGTGGLHVYLHVVNWSQYAHVFFTTQPPPCGPDPQTSRTWAYVFSLPGNQQLNLFCVLWAPGILENIWFLTTTANKPKAVYVVLWDRQTNKKVKSNTVKIP